MKSTTGFSLSVKALAIVALCFVAGGAFGQSDTKAESFYTGGAPAAEAMCWDLGCQAYSFNRFTFYEAIDKVASMGMHVIEAYPGQRLSKDKPEDVLLHHDMDPALHAEVLAKLKESNVKAVCYGVVGLSRQEEESRKVFDFAKAMGIGTIVSEPSPKDFDTIEKLADEYGINVAIHNHPKPSRYWDYKTVLKACEGRSKRIGSCADSGHWMRSGINPLEAVKALEGRIISFHLKDLNKYGKPGEHDVIWGTGKADVKAILTEVHRQGFKGVFSVEYEHNWEHSVPEIAASAKYFNEVAAGLQAQGGGSK